MITLGCARAQALGVFRQVAFSKKHVTLAPPDRLAPNLDLVANLLDAEEAACNAYNVFNETCLEKRRGVVAAFEAMRAAVNAEERKALELFDTAVKNFSKKLEIECHALGVRVDQAAAGAVVTDCSIPNLRSPPLTPVVDVFVEVQQCLRVLRESWACFQCDDPACLWIPKFAWEFENFQRTSNRNAHFCEIIPREKVWSLGLLMVMPEIDPETNWMRLPAGSQTACCLTEQCIPLEDCPRVCRGIAVSVDTLVVSSPNTNQILVYCAKTGKRLNTVDLEVFPWGVCFAGGCGTTDTDLGAGNRTVFVGTVCDGVFEIDCLTGKRVREIIAPGMYSDTRWVDANGDVVLVSGVGTMVCFSAKSGKILLKEGKRYADELVIARTVPSRPFKMLLIVENKLRAVSFERGVLDSLRFGIKPLGDARISWDGVVFLLHHNRIDVVDTGRTLVKFDCDPCDVPQNIAISSGFLWYVYRGNFHGIPVSKWRSAT